MASELAVSMSDDEWDSSSTASHAFGGHTKNDGVVFVHKGRKGSKEAVALPLSTLLNNAPRNTSDFEVCFPSVVEGHKHAALVRCPRVCDPAVAVLGWRTAAYLRCSRCFWWLHVFSLK